jgi:hypothetical protein
MRRALPFLLFVGCSSAVSSSSDGGQQDGQAPTDGAVATDGGGDGGSANDAAPCVDPCPAPNGGVMFGCQKRFVYGVNYAWRNFAGDFGGIAQWGIKGVSVAPAGYVADLADMQKQGANVIRWWLFPDFRGDGVTFDGMNVPTGVSATALADFQKALELADQAGVFLMPTFFSFDNFRPTQTNMGVLIRGIAPIALDANARKALVDKVVRPIVKAAQQSPYARRVFAWEVINEPEWAVTGASLYGGDQAFDPTAGLTALTHGQMEAFIKDVVGGIRAESTGMVSVGGAAPKWAHAWSMLGLDFYQWHYYDWINQYWPYTDGPGKYGLGKPVVVGEMPMDKLANQPFASVVGTFWQNGYAGALGWSYSDAKAAVPNLQTFSGQHMCETHYDPTAKAEVGAIPSGARTARSPRLCTHGPNGRPTCAP